eukprot:gene28057-34708_t
MPNTDPDVGSASLGFNVTDGCGTDLFDASPVRGYHSAVDQGSLHLRYDFGASIDVDGYAIHVTSRGGLSDVNVTCYATDGEIVYTERTPGTELGVVSGWINVTFTEVETRVCASVSLDVTSSTANTRFTEVALLQQPHANPPMPPSPPPALPASPPMGMLIAGYYPVFSDVSEAMVASPVGTAFPIKLVGYVYYMPTALTQGVNAWYGDYGAHSSVSAVARNVSSSSAAAWTVTARNCPVSHRLTAEECMGTVADGLGAEVGYEMVNPQFPVLGCVHVVLSHVRSRVVYNAIAISDARCHTTSHVRRVWFKTGVATANTDQAGTSRLPLPRPRDPRYDLLRYRMHFERHETPLHAVNGHGRSAPADSFNMSHGVGVVDADVPDSRVALKSLLLNSSNRGLHLSDRELSLGRRAPYSSFTVSYWSKVSLTDETKYAKVLVPVPEERFVDEQRTVAPVTEPRKLSIVEAGTESWAYANPHATNPMERMHDGSIGTHTHVANFAVFMFNRTVHVEELMLAQNAAPADTN